MWILFLYINFSNTGLCTTCASIDWTLIDISLTKIAQFAYSMKFNSDGDIRKQLRLSVMNGFDTFLMLH